MEINYDTVFQYLHSGSYPDGVSDNRKRAIRNRATKFTIVDGVLFYAQRQWINDEENQKRIIESCHSDKLGGHFGRDKTREKVTSR